MAHRRKLRGRAGRDAAQPLVFTIQGELFLGEVNPEKYGPLTDPWHQGEESALETEMRLFGAATRFAFGRLLEGVTGSGVKAQLQKLFGLNSRYAGGALRKAGQIIESQKKLIPLEIKETRSKLQKTQRKLQAERKKEKQLRDKHDLVYAYRMARVIKGHQAREKKLTEKLAEYEAHQKNGTIPKVVFGGRKLWEDLVHGRSSPEEWRRVRRARLYTEGGNPNLKLSYGGKDRSGAEGNPKKGDDPKPGRGGKDFSLSVVISHLSLPTGHVVYNRRGKQQERDTMTRAPRVEGRLWIPPKYRMLMLEHLLGGRHYTVELIRGRDGKYRVHICLSLKMSEAAADLSRGVLGFDTNPDGIAVYSVDREGNRDPFPEGFHLPKPSNPGKFPGDFTPGIGVGCCWLKVPELAYARGFRRDYLIGVLARVLVDTAKALGKPLACEGLDFKKEHGTNRAFNRMSSNFPYAKILEAIIRRCRREGVALLPRDPAYTSCMGFWKYMTREGISVHQAASKVIGRRALGLSERFDPDLRERLAALREKLVAAAEAAERQRRAPMEGTRPKLVGIAKRLRASLSEERLIRCNGYPRASGRQGRGQGRSRTSPRGALVELGRYRWARAAAVSGT